MAGNDGSRLRQEWTEQSGSLSAAVLISLGCFSSTAFIHLDLLSLYCNLLPLAVALAHFLSRDS